MSQIIIISGKQGSGKSTLQKALASEWQKRMKGGRAITVNFADIIYEMHDSVIGILERYWPKRDIVKDGPLLQLLGTEWGRNTIDKDIWVKCLLAKIRILERQNSHYENLIFIVGDCRFKNEFDLFSEALRIRLAAPLEIRKQRVSMWRDNDAHPSEIDLDSYSTDGKFDLILNTFGETINTQEHIELIMAQLQKNNWKEKRIL